MKIKVIVENVGTNHARLEVEDDCEVNGIRRLLEKLNRELSGGHAPDSSFTEVNPAMLNRKGGVEPASEEAVRALWVAAKNNGMDIESACREYGVNPKDISKQDCWRVTQDLNKRSGYGK